MILEINVLKLLIKENRRRGKVEGTRRKGGEGREGKEERSKEREERKKKKKTHKDYGHNIKYFHLLHDFKINFKRLTFINSEAVHFAKHPREKGQHILFISCTSILFVSKGLTGLVSRLFEMRMIFSKVLANSWCD